jgi:IS30 family transposase
MTHITPSTPVLKRKYFSFEERRYLERLRQQNVGIRECARILVRSHSVILRELARAPAYDRYRAEYAQRVALRAQSNKGNVGKLTSNASLRSAVVEGILRDSSPEQISARIGRMGEAFGVQGRVSTETIYQFLYRDPLAREQSSISICEDLVLIDGAPKEDANKGSSPVLLTERVFTFVHST